MRRNAIVPGVRLLLVLGLAGAGHSCVDPASAYRFTGIVCRLTYPAAVVLNEKTTEVIQAAFQHAKYPSIHGEKSIWFMGTLKYRLHNLEIHNLTIGKSDFELRKNEGIGIIISNVSAVFKGSINYGYGSAIFSVEQSVDFEVDSQIDLVINSKLYCGKGRVAADTSDCYLTFHKLRLLLQGDREPGWMKRVFTDIITFTVKLVVKGQICKEINKVANILADFIQDTAAKFLSDGDILVDIGVTSYPIITSNYIESYHKGLVSYNGITSKINASVFKPDQIPENRSLYFWISDDVLNSLLAAAHQDGRFVRNITGTELTDLFKIELSTMPPIMVNRWLHSEEPVLKVTSVSVPHLQTNTKGTSVKTVAAVELSSAAENISLLHFETEVEVLVTASYSDKKISLTAKAVNISISNVCTSANDSTLKNASTSANDSTPANDTTVANVSSATDFTNESPSTNDSTSAVVSMSSNDSTSANDFTSENVSTLANDFTLTNVSASTNVYMSANVSGSAIFLENETSINYYLRKAVEKIGIPKVITYLEPALTQLMNEQGLNLFDLINPEVISHDGYVLVQMDFGFPHHLLVKFLKRTLE